MSQSRALSAVEALANLAIGWLVALATQMVVFPAVGLQANLAQTLSVSGAFTAVSVLRSYAVRRLFEALARRKGPGGRVDLRGVQLRTGAGRHLFKRP